MNSHCPNVLLESALDGSLSKEDEAALHRHLEECEACSIAMEQMAGGEAWCQEAVNLLLREKLDAVVPSRELWSEVDFTVEHLEPTDEPNVLGRLGGYDVLEVIGHGGMGVVLKGFDRELKRSVAIKVLAPHLAQNSLARKRFAREAQAAAAVVHPHVVAIHQVQPGGRLPFLVMPLVAGESLAERLKAQGTLELKEILRIGMQAAAGLAAAHEQGLVHRDVKPANILLEKGVERAVLTDFGLARAADDVTLTRWGVIAGTPQYMSPEQARGEALDGRSDLFSLGCVLYEMATGVSPFRADSVMATMRRLVDDSPQPMASLNPDLPPWLIALVDRLLEKDPSRRFKSAHEVSELLEGCLAHVQQPANVPLPAGVPKPARRKWRLFKLGIKGVLAMIGTLGVGLLGVFLLAANPPDIAGEWTGEDWGTVILKRISDMEYRGRYLDGEIQLKWSRIERRFNGTWREGRDRFGELSVRLVGDEIRGALTTDPKSKINPATPRLADLTWRREVLSESPDGTRTPESQHDSTSPAHADRPGETPLWNAFGVTPAPVSTLTAKVLESIGLHLRPITRDDFREKNVFAKYPGGLDVTFVRSHGPAEKAGIHEVDIVVGLQGQPTARLKDLDQAVQDAADQIKSGNTKLLQFEVLRGGETVKVNVPFSVRDLDPQSPFDRRIITGALVEPGGYDLSAYRSRLGERFSFSIVGTADGPLWGTDLYTHDSCLAKAAVHAGVVKVGEQAIVQVTILKGPTWFQGSTRHGVTSGNWNGEAGTYAAYTLERLPAKNYPGPMPPARLDPATGNLSGVNSQEFWIDFGPVPKRAVKGLGDGATELDAGAAGQHHSATRTLEPSATYESLLRADTSGKVTQEARNKVAALEQFAAELAKANQSGLAPREDVLRANRAALAARLELCQSDDQRIEILNMMLKDVQEEERLIKAKVEAGKVGRVKLLELLSARLDIESKLATLHPTLGAGDDKSQQKTPAQWQSAQAKTADQENLTGNGGPKSLAEAVRIFNANAASDPIGKRQPLLTVEEILNVLRTTLKSPELHPVTDETLRQIENIVAGGPLPKGFQLEVLTDFQPSDELEYKAWSVRLLVPHATIPNGTHALLVRNTLIDVRSIGPRERAVIQKWNEKGEHQGGIGSFERGRYAKERAEARELDDRERSKREGAVEENVSESDQEKFQGTWLKVGEELNGKPVAKEDMRPGWWRFGKDRATIYSIDPRTGDPEKCEYVYVVSPSHEKDYYLKRIVLLNGRRLEGPGSARPDDVQAIFKAEGDSLTIAIGDTGFPKTFKTAEGDGVVVVVFKRERETKTTPGPRSEKSSTLLEDINMFERRDYYLPSGGEAKGVRPNQ